MIKGARKQMIVVRTGNNRYFDEAYFVLREEVQRGSRKNTDILSEANRLLEEMTPKLSPTVNSKKQQWLFFGIGGLCGAVFSMIVTLLLV